jgi:hypothetical protein
MWWHVVTWQSASILRVEESVEPGEKVALMLARGTKTGPMRDRYGQCLYEVEDVGQEMHREMLVREKQE